MLLPRWNDCRQADDHRRQADDEFCKATTKLVAQGKRNRREWLRLARQAIHAGDLDMAIARIQQAKLETVHG